MSGDGDGIQKGLAQIDASYQNVVTLRGQVGARAAQLDVYSSRLADAKSTISDSLSQVEDVDIADTLTRLQMEQNVYQTSLITATRMTQTSLADYLK
jgi:flagellar hook-associated protein 3 FlgL